MTGTGVEVVMTDTGDPASMTDTKAPTPRKVRKRQAVTMTKSAATKAIVQQNASSSILLKAPMEVRDNILGWVLGDRLIHITYLYEKCIDPNWEKALANPNLCSTNDFAKAKRLDEQCLFSSFCVADKSEQAVYNEVNKASGGEQTIMDPDNDGTFYSRHKHCLMCQYISSNLTTPDECQAQPLTFNNNLSVLAVCRLLYEESNNILWQTNTFSFNHSSYWDAFNKSMTLSQKHKIKRVHINQTLYIDTQPWCGPSDGLWTRYTKPRVMLPLKNLKVLHLTFDQHCLWNTPERVPRTRHGLQNSNAESQENVTISTDTLLGFRMLPWKNTHVTVVTDGDASTQCKLITEPWTNAQKLEFAERVRAKFAAPDSAEIHAAEIAAQKAAKEAARIAAAEEEAEQARIAAAAEEEAEQARIAHEEQETEGDSEQESGEDSEQEAEEDSKT